ncbi:MAG: hypothetical protein J0L69_09060 [Bacteroidetes bacterium]|nr:hypothetical protein [Bacteroidota bacterium]
MIITRKKLIYCPDGSLPWAKTHAMNPTIDVLNKDVIRVYFASLDENKTGRIGYVDLNANNPEEILEVSKRPILETGIKGTFDDNGMIPSSIVTVNGVKYLYYFGFQLVKQVRFMMFTGVAISTDGGKSFKRHANVPVLDRNNTDLYIRSLPHVMQDNETYKVWYSGVNEWTDVLGKELPVGNIRYTESSDGLNFNRDNFITCLEPRPEEFSLSRAFVFKHESLYKMLFSCRLRSNDMYQLGYAESSDGKKWHRNDSKIQVSTPSGEWDKDMICYTSLVPINGKNYLFYNGNGFGTSGFGYAEVNF